MNKLFILTLVVALGMFTLIQGDFMERHYKPLLRAYIYSFMDNLTNDLNNNLSIGSSTVEQMNHDRYLKCGSWLNRGIGSSVITHTIEYITHLPDSLETESILIYAGENDIAYGKDTIQALTDFKRLIDLISLKFPKAQIIIFALKLSPKRQQFSVKFYAYNEQLKRFASTLENATFYPSQLSKSVPIDSKYYLADRLHLSHSGYRELTRSFNTQCKKQTNGSII